MAHWRDEYIARSEILQKLQLWFEQGLSDEDIARRWDCSVELVWRSRTRWKFFRPEECQDCGCREYVQGVECPNPRCISVWPKRVIIREDGKKGKR